MTTALTTNAVKWFVAALDVVLTARVGSKTPPDPNGTLSWVPFVRVLRIGGPDDGLALDIPTMAFHAFATTQPAADDLAIAVRDAVYALRGVPTNGAVITAARTLSGPSWASTENQNLAHAVLLMQARITATS